MKLTFFILTLFLSNVFGQCLVNDSTQTKLGDSLAILLRAQEQCPQNVFELKALMAKENLSVSTSMVANRGFHNPEAGSFSLFESVTGFSSAFNINVKQGHFFFGHFTKVSSKILDFDQQPRQGKLMIEAIVWDHEKKLYNFYELIGTQSGGEWFYRGDSKDVIEDNLNLHLQSNPEKPSFGNKMRCSACHTSGGPIMKELEAPFNDWWTVKRKLLFASNKPSAKLQNEIENLIDASDFADLVKLGIKELNKSENFTALKSSLSLQQQLKPLFCTVEINLISDKMPLESPANKLNVSSAYWVNPLLFNKEDLELDKKLYIESLEQFNFSFPEIQRLDADHGWISPVKSFADQSAIQLILDNHIISEEFALDVLAIDMENPLFSKQRCSLLSEIPAHLSSDWMSIFQTNLTKNKSAPAKALLKNLSAINKDEHLEKAELLIENIKDLALVKEGMDQLIIGLHKTRVSVFQNEISQNPLGQILEPGFRVIFPLPN